MAKKLKLLTGLVAITAMSWTVGKAALAHRSDERDADTLEQFHADGTGVLSGLDTNEQTATIKGSFIRGSATLQFKLTNDVKLGTPLPFCAFKRGNATITDSHGKTITMSLAGVGCGSNNATDNTEVTYVITGGTRGATGGTGRLSRGIEPPDTNGATFFVQFDGNVRLSDED